MDDGGTGPDPGDSGEAATGERQSKRRLFSRGAMLLLVAVSIYLVAPSVLEVLSSWDQLRSLEIRWFMGVGVTQIATFGLIWALQRLALRTTRWLPVITSQLAGNAASRLVPGGAAVSTAVQFRLLRSAGVSPDVATSGLTASGLLQLATTLILPLLALPGALLGGPTAEGLLRVAWAGAGLFVVLSVIAMAALRDDHLLSWFGLLADRFRAVAPGAIAPDRPVALRLLAERDALVEGLDGHWGKAALFTGGRMAADYLSLVMAITAFGGQARLSLILLAYASSIILGMIPLTPGGLGFVEAGLTAALALAGISASAAVSSALLYRLFSFWLPIPAGLVAGVVHRRRYG